jgi:putative transposase
VCFSVEYQAQLLPPLSNEIGIDVGLTDFATLSNGKSIPNPRFYKNAEPTLRHAQRKVARRKKGSNRRRKVVALLQKIHARIKNQRNDFQHKFSFWLVNNFGTIAIEDLNVKGLASGILAKSVHDVAWAAFFSKLAYKAANAGRRLIAVNPNGTSQTCLCGAKVWKKLSDREHVCTACGLVEARDVVSAQVILQRARISPSVANVSVVELSVY